MNILKFFKILLLAIYVLFLTCNSDLHGQNFTVSGFVTSKESGDTLTGVNIYEPDIQMGVTTDFHGFYSLTLPEGKRTIVFSSIGYESIEIPVNLNKNLTIDVALVNATVEFEEVVITSRMHGRNLTDAGMSAISMDIEKIKRIPAFLGEVDVLRAVQLLPGVHSAGDGNTGFFVRGGDADQNLVLFDNAIVYNASHLFNFFSIFNPDAVSDMKLYKGGIPPSYGGRLSSVLDITMKEGDMDEYRFNGGLGLISSRLSFEGPLQKGRSSFLVAGRRTYADIFLKLSSDELTRGTQLYFYDLNAKMNYVVNEKNHLLISGYYGRDVTAFRDIFAFDWGNATGTLQWNRFFSEKFTGNLALMVSDYSFNLSGFVDPMVFNWQSYVNNTNLQANFSWQPNMLNKFSFGVSSIYHNVDPGAITSSFGDDSPVERELMASKALESGAYFFNMHRIWDNRLALEYGLRVSMFQLIGPGRQYEYDRTHPVWWRVSDTILLENGKFYDRFIGWEPRVNLRLGLSPNSSLKAGYNRMTQFIQQAQSSQSMAPYDAWFMTSNNIPPQLADQYVLGYFRNFFSDKLETSVEIYYKDINNITDVIDNGDLLGNEFLESQLRTGKGWSYGVEFFLTGSTEKLDGMIGYTWSRTRRKIEGINEGNPYFSPFDRRHDLNLTGGYSLSTKLSMSLTFIYSSGRAYTFPIGKIRYQGESAPIFSERNSGNLPDYHRLDLSLTYVPGKGKNKRYINTWNFSVFNVYGRLNPISASFKRSDNPDVPSSSFFYIPGPIPAVTWNFSF